MFDRSPVAELVTRVRGFDRERDKSLAELLPRGFVRGRDPSLEELLRLPLLPGVAHIKQLALAVAAGELTIDVRREKQGYQLPLTPEPFLQDLAADKVKDARLSLGAWSNELVYPLFVEACFADPIYGGNLGKVFWKCVKMWGTSSLEDKLAGDLGNVIEAISTGGRSVGFFYSRKISAEQFGTFATLAAYLREHSLLSP